MTSKDGRFGGVSVDRGTDEARQPWARVMTSAMCRTVSQARHNFVKSRHAFYVVTADNLFAPPGGSVPLQSSRICGKLSMTADIRYSSARSVHAKLVWTGFHGAATVIDADSSS